MVLDVSRLSVPPSGWHLAALASLAVSHPVAAVLVRGPEFFVAHDLDRTGLMLLAAGLFAGIPAAVWMVAVAARRLHPDAGRFAAMTLLVVLVTLIAAQPLKRVGIDGHPTLPLAGVAGLLGLGLYLRFAAARLFVSALAPAPFVAALVFFLSTPVAALMRPPGAPPAAPGGGPAPPVVMIVFDQLPLLSLLDEHRQIDRRRFPNFAALADSSTWYRNTTAAATLTNWALPALVTGRYPRADLLPAAVHHPESLFSLLSATHRFHVVEPITALCPPQLCQAPGGVAWMPLVSDLAVVYGHIALPVTLTTRLPAVTHNWRGFGFDFWQRRWTERRDDDRRSMVLDWIAEIDARDQPVLHFLHVLLPHEPYVYLPTGQMGRPGGEPLGLEEFGVWSDDRRLVSIAYQQHLLQVQFVDRLLGLAVDRLKAAGIYDETLLVVVSDHGVAFRPQRPFKQPVDSTLAEIGGIPFFVKGAGTQPGRVDDRPLQAIDVLPTIAHELGTGVSWDVEGVAAQRPSPTATDTRRLYRDRAERYVAFSHEEFERSLQAGEQRKRDAVSPDPAVLGWPGDPARYLIGTAVASLDIAGPPAVAASVDNPDAFAIVDPEGPYVPVFVSGTATAIDGTSGVQVPLALAINGIIRATTQPSRRRVSGRTGFWAALVPPDAYRPGANDVTLLEVVSTDPPRLRTVAVDSRGSGPLNLLDPGVAAALGIQLQGFYAPETSTSATYRWTNGDARLIVPVEQSRPPRELEVRTLMATEAAAIMEIRVNDCVVFEGPSAEPPIKRLALSACAPSGDTATITISSGTVVPGPDDARPLGVALESVRLR
jgi:hypothetical protein